ncbi:S9 family peptidase [Dyadobacter sandarakinus]|uniref:DPP IV N-terminal domain-containing protein n=1 Tax=Dyadobacter sandarakinus TaxID=2747268 RepID=A0ABX7I1H2_9BACT|nr:DPP IV N-terminal domain-containing protein [Dyadobacter sandarakinus]QRQ99888.1 DPP IV N-terminal domain-containing protein [Dyadobacter sandarakinus]
MKKWLPLVLPVLIAGPSLAQQARFTDKDYEHAEMFLAHHTQRYLDQVPGKPVWLSGERFWYRVLTSAGSEFVLVDARRGTKSPAFDHEKLAKALRAVSGKNYTAFMLPFQEFTFSADQKSILFSAAGKKWSCNLKTYQLTEDAASKPIHAAEREAGMLSPDGKKAAFIKDWNLWVRDVETGQTTQLTTDGTTNFGYATDNAGWRHSDRPVLLWSPDSRKIATFQQDERRVGDMYLVTTNVGHPRLEAWKYPLPGDSVVAMIHRVIIEVGNPKVVRLQVPPDPHRSTLGDDISRAGVLNDAEWSSDGSQLAFVSTSRDHKQARFRVADATTGAVKDIFEENVPTQFESGQNAISWKYLAAGREVIWYSERDNWGHLYLYDVATGQLKNQITRGEWVVTQLVRVDEKKRQIYFLANAREGGNPYYTRFYKVDFDGKNLTLLTPEKGVHAVTLSASGDYFTDSYSEPDVAPVYVLRNSAGKQLLELARTDVSRLKTAGWKPPIPFSVKAHDGKTDVYGLLYTPTRMDSTRKYPVVDYIYPGPQGGSVRTWAFSASRRDNQALAELGFIVMELEGTSNPLRSKRFHDMSYGNMADNTLPDQVAAVRQLAAQHAWIDTTKVGIWGHSGGGFAAACAMFRYPDFFKVGIAESGNHDNRNYEDDWGERYNGLLQEGGADGHSSYHAQANQVHAGRLKGKLLLAHGLMDDNVPPYNTMLVIEALQDANKDYDLIVFPNTRHGFANYTGYMMRRRWDYFIKNLMGSEPPKEYLMKYSEDPRNHVE